MDVPCAQFTTLGIGGPARYFARVESERELIESSEFAEEKGLPSFILGGGSNVLIADNGFDGLVIQIRSTGIQSEKIPSGEVRVTAQAGEDWDSLVAYCVNNDLAGVECLSGIPGSVGGTPIQNVGAYGQEVAETITSVRCLDRNKKKIIDLSNAECGFTYRKSIFNSTMRDRYVVLSVTFTLKKGGEPRITYKDLKDQFRESRPTIAEVREAVLRVRRAKSMVLDESDPNSRSAGSFFKNPIVSLEHLAELQLKFEGIPFFEFGEAVKIPAAWLIEQAGFHKGFSFGNAGISSNHTLAIINRGHATAAEVVALKDQIQRTVEAKFGIELQPEPVFVGF